jgi:hypothetical protein
MNIKKHGQSTPPSGGRQQQALPNQKQPKHQVQPRRNIRHPALCVFFTAVWLVFFLFVLLPWQIHHRSSWSFSKSVGHDYNFYKGALASLFTSSDPAPEQFFPPEEPSVTTSLPNPISTKVFPEPEPQPKMSTEQT